MVYGFSVFPHYDTAYIVEITEILSQNILTKNFVKATVLLLLKSLFDEIFFWSERISRFSTWHLIVLQRLKYINRFFT